jgi:nitrate reductase gamma subunit
MSLSFAVSAAGTLAAETAVGEATPLDTVLWVVVPYVCLAVFAVGHYWRYRYDKFGWTTRSSQLYESRLLRLGSPLFHFGILVVLMGHVMGLGIPKPWTQAVGISDGLYHFLAVSLGAVAGVCTLAGMAILIYRRRTVGPVFSATTRMDKLMYVALATVIVLGLWNTAAGSILNLTGHYDYRDGVSVWFRGIFRFDLHPELMGAAPLGFQLHGLTAFLLFALWPFTRLVHVFSAPLGYLWRPYVVYRSKEPRMGATAQRPGWERVGDRRR